MRRRVPSPRAGRTRSKCGPSVIGKNAVSACVLSSRRARARMAVQAGLAPEHDGGEAARGRLRERDEHPRAEVALRLAGVEAVGVEVEARAVAALVVRAVVLDVEAGGVVHHAAQAGGGALHRGERRTRSRSPPSVEAGRPRVQRAVFEAVPEDQVGLEALGEDAVAGAILPVGLPTPSRSRPRVRGHRRALLGARGVRVEPELARRRARRRSRSDVRRCRGCCRPASSCPDDDEVAVAGRARPAAGSGCRSCSCSRRNSAPSGVPRRRTAGRRCRRRSVLPVAAPDHDEVSVRVRRRPRQRLGGAWCRCSP